MTSYLSRSGSELLASQNSTIGPDGVQEVIRYVEVPIIEEVVTTVPKRETVEVEKRFERKETEYFDRVVEIPTIRTVKKIVEIPTIQEVIKNVTRKEIVAVPTEVIKYVTKKETRVVEEERRIQGEIIEVPKIIDVIKEVIIPRYHDDHVPTIVAQTVVPVVTDEGTIDPVECVTYEPYLVPVDIYIPLPIDKPVVCDGKVNETLKNVEIPSPQYNLLLRNMNSDILRENRVYQELPFRAESDGTVHFLSTNKSSLSRQNSSGIPLHHLASSSGLSRGVSQHSIPIGREQSMQLDYNKQPSGGRYWSNQETSASGHRFHSASSSATVE